MPATYPNASEIMERPAKVVLLDICRSPKAAQNLEKLVRCLLQFWDAAKCAIAVDIDVSSEVFENLRYAPENVENADFSTLSLLDIKIFLHLAVHCAYVLSERIKENTGTFFSRATADRLTTDRQCNWWGAAWALVHNAGKAEDHVRLQEGLTTIRLKSRDIPELHLLVSVAEMLESEVPQIIQFGGTAAEDSKTVAASDYAKLYWTAIDNIWESDRILPPNPIAFFFAGLPLMSSARLDDYRSLSKYYHALNALMHRKEDECVSILEGMQTHMSFFALAQIYKNSAENINCRLNDDGAASVLRKTMLGKARDSLRSGMRKLKEDFSSGVLDASVIMQVLNAIEMLICDSCLALLPSNGEITKKRQSDVVGPTQERHSCAVAQKDASSSAFPAVPAPNAEASVSASSSLPLSKGPSVPFGLPSVQCPPAGTTSAPSTVSISNPNGSALVTRPTFGVFDSQSSSVPSLASLANQPVAPSFQPLQTSKRFQDSGSAHFENTTPATPQRTGHESEEDGSESPETFEPTVDFQPVVPLPALVETKSGEEEEEILFRERAKLFRWEPSSKEFKERGVGEMKILKHRDTGVVRVLMRREQVLKLCSNHRITPGMKLSPMQKSKRAFIWFCHDYSDKDLKEETFAIRFKDVEAANKFKEAFEEVAL